VTRAIAASIDKDMDKMAAFAWLDCIRKFLVGTTCCSGEGKQTERKHLLWLHKASQLKAVKTCCHEAGAIDHHSRIHLADLRINKNLKTNNWAKGVVKEGQFLDFQDYPHQCILPFPANRYQGRQGI